VTRIYARSYPGQETDVSYRVDLRPDGSGQLINLVAEASDDTIDTLRGDSQTWDFPVRREFASDDQLRFKYVNDDPNNAHPVHMRVHVDYEGLSIIDSVDDTLRGFL